MPVKKIITDYGKAVEIGRVLHEGFERRNGFFEHTPLPEYINPDIVDGSREQALFFTYVMALDYQTNANRLWSRSRVRFNRQHDVFEPEVILATNRIELEKLIKSLGGRYPSVQAKAWQKISSILLDDYGGDPRNIAIEPMSLKEVKSRLSEFPILKGPKVGRVYTRIMGEKGLFKITDLHTLDVAIDVQVVKFTFYTGVLKVEGFIDEDFQSITIRKPLEDVWRRAAKELKCPPWKLDEPIWIVASNLCTNFSCRSCPVVKHCLKSFDYEFTGGKLFHNSS